MKALPASIRAVALLGDSNPALVHMVLSQTGVTVGTVAKEFVANVTCVHQ